MSSTGGLGEAMKETTVSDSLESKRGKTENGQLDERREEPKVSSGGKWEGETTESWSPGPGVGGFRSGAGARQSRPGDDITTYFGG